MLPMTDRFWIACAISVFLLTVYMGRARAQSSGCFPPCRAGYVCKSDQCVSKCNPPCAGNQTCTEAGACVSVTESPRDSYADDSDSDKYRHTGFFLRFSPGLGWSQADAPYGIHDSGFTSFFAFDIGGALSENLILHARLGGLTNHGKKDVVLNINDESIDTEKTGIYYGLIGGGLTYYFMPVNIYLSVVLGIAASALVVDGDDIDKDVEIEGSKPGLGLNLDVGKEWWVGSEWGLGVAARFTFSSVGPNKSSTSDDRLENVGLGVLFSATYN
jgi:hypothetical protein